ncbi:MAG: hypothetical protein IPK69_06405 [Phycisphaerales bacterium]|nr:MAG: hypothetical protein IPK69_06405 [Phycisphaerales bacterium]
MKTTSTKNTKPRTRAYRAAGPLPPPPTDVKVLTREDAATFMGVALKTFSDWERAGRVTIPRYRAATGTGRAIYYVEADLERLREEFRRLKEPYPDPERPGVYRVPLRSRLHSMEALIDAEDLPIVEGKNWNWGPKSDGRGGEVLFATMTQRQTPLKRLILGLGDKEFKDVVVGYANGDPLDLRRSNLVLKTRTEVNLSRAKSMTRAGRAVSSVYLGVDWDATRRLWRAQIGTKEMHRMIGRFRDEAQAAAAYDAAAREIFGDSAPLNFPDGKIPAPTFLGADGETVREKCAYTLARGLPTPPKGVAMLTRDEAAAALDVSEGTLGQWERSGEVTFTRYREKDQTGTPILYAAADIARLREELDQVGQPYADPHPARAGVWRVPLRTLGGYIEALIDEADLPIVQGKKWNYAARSRAGQDNGVVFQAGADDAPRRQLRRLILALDGESAAIRVHHANGNPLDCRRANLVISNPEQSARGAYKILRRCGRPTTSRYKGVCWNERVGAWTAQIRVADVNSRLGHFDDEAEAAMAYDEAAREVWGDEARVNFPEPGEKPSAAAPVSPADLWTRAGGSAARMPGQPTDFDVVLNGDGSVTLSWRSTHAAASAGVTFAIFRRLPGQRESVRLGTVDGTTSAVRRPTFTDATVGIDCITGDGEGAEYTVQGARADRLGEKSEVVRVRFDARGRWVYSASRVRKAA